MRLFTFLHSRNLVLYLAFLLAISPAAASPLQAPPSYYALLIYHLKDTMQESRLDAYLQHAFIPAAHKAGLNQVGVFKPVANDTASDRRVYVLLPGRSADQLVHFPWLPALRALPAANDYQKAAWDQPVYTRMETVLLEAFSGMPGMAVPQLSSPKTERIYELRSYESSSEQLHLSKVAMFNNGEIAIFQKLGFNAVFYARVLAGSHMPNLMYMTSFENKAARDQHWQAFGEDKDWNQLKSQPQYAHNVSHIDVIHMHPALYSDF